MKLIGKLNLSKANNERSNYDDYIMMCKGRNTNLTKLLELLILEDIHFSIGYAGLEEKIVDVKGKLYKNKIAPKYYTFWINGTDIDNVLWGLVGSKLEINLRNITVESG